jgi:hypothetical protein
LRAALGAEEKGDTLERLRSCGTRYRAFALSNRHFYAIMFEGAIPRDRDAVQVEEHARAAFGTLVRIVELGAAAGVLEASDPFEAAQQIWSCLHGAVALELKGLVLTPDPEATYRALLATLIRGFAIG